MIVFCISTCTAASDPIHFEIWLSFCYFCVRESHCFNIWQVLYECLKTAIYSLYSFLFHKTVLTSNAYYYDYSWFINVPCCILNKPFPTFSLCLLISLLFHNKSCCIAFLNFLFCLVLGSWLTSIYTVYNALEFYRVCTEKCYSFHTLPPSRQLPSSTANPSAPISTFQKIQRG